jgi:hypothetical protein
MTKADERRALVVQWKASGQTAAEFGCRRGLSRKLLHNWAYRLGLTKTPKRKAVTGTSAVRLLRIVGRGDRAHEPRRPDPERTGVRLTFAGATMDVDAGFDAATLRRILLIAQSMQHGGQ